MGNRIVVRRGARQCRTGGMPPHVLFASDGASSVEQALKIAFSILDQSRHCPPHDLSRRMSPAEGGEQVAGHQFYRPVAPVVDGPGIWHE